MAELIGKEFEYRMGLCESCFYMWDDICTCSTKPINLDKFLKTYGGKNDYSKEKSNIDWKEIHNENQKDFDWKETYEEVKDS